MLFLQASISNLFFRFLAGHFKITTLKERSVFIGLAMGGSIHGFLHPPYRSGRGGGCLELSKRHLRPGPADGALLPLPQVSSIAPLIGSIDNLF
jgi:hypothetical protein